MSSSNGKVAVAGVAAVGVIIAAIVGLVLAWGYVSGLSKASGGEVIVVRNGGLFDDNSFQQVIQPNSGITSTGLWSENHIYPASQRFFRVGPEGTADSQEVINVPTRDGVSLGVEGTWYFELNTDEAVLKAFDDKFGTRTYDVGNGERLPAWSEDPRGWGAFLDSTFSTVAQNSSRQSIGGNSCAELIPSCILVQSQNGAVADVSAEQLEAAATTSDSALLTVQKTMADNFVREANEILGEGVLKNVQFSLTRMTLPQNLQDAITRSLETQTDSNAKINAAKATETQAQAEANANVTRQNGYNACPVCGEIELRKSIPTNITVWAPGADATVPVR